MALHAAIYLCDEEDPEIQSATAWNPECRTPLTTKNGQDWKSYCFISIPECGGGDAICETAWAFDMSSPGEDDGVSANELGWFDNFFGGNPPTPWGWLFRYTVTGQ